MGVYSVSSVSISRHGCIFPLSVHDVDDHRVGVNVWWGTRVVPSIISPHSENLQGISR